MIIPESSIKTKGKGRNIAEKIRKVKNRGTKKDSAGGTTTPERFRPRHSTYSLKTRTERAFHGSKHLKHLPTQGLKFLQ